MVPDTCQVLRAWALFFLFLLFLPFLPFFLSFLFLGTHMLVEEGNSKSFVNSFQVLHGTVGRVPTSPASPALRAITPRTTRHLEFGPDRRDVAIVLRAGETQLPVENKYKRASGGEAHYKTMPSRPTSKFLRVTSDS